MGKTPWFPFYVDDWRASVDIRRMTPEQRGYYIALLAEQWAAPNCRLPNDMEMLSFLAGEPDRENFLKVSGPVLDKFPVQVGGHTRANARLDHEASKALAKIEQNRLAGKQSAKVRYIQELEGNARSTPVQRPMNDSESDTESHTHKDKRESQNPKEAHALDFQFYLTFWNENCKTLPQIRLLTKGRKTKLRSRLEAVGFKDDFTEAVRRVAVSAFCTGQNRQGWRVTFDWLIENGENIAKVIEGNYDEPGSGALENYLKHGSILDMPTKARPQ